MARLGVFAGLAWLLRRRALPRSPLCTYSAMCAGSMYVRCICAQYSMFNPCCVRTLTYHLRAAHCVVYGHVTCNVSFT
jgi:hypothetical protein